MLSCEQVETLNGVIQHMDRNTVATALANFKACFPLDFTAEFYAREPVTRLRHILFGLCLHSQKMLETVGD